MPGSAKYVCVPFLGTPTCLGCSLPAPAIRAPVSLLHLPKLESSLACRQTGWGGTRPVTSDISQSSQKIVNKSLLQINTSSALPWGKPPYPPRWSRMKGRQTVSCCANFCYKRKRKKTQGFCILQLNGYITCDTVIPAPHPTSARGPIYIE